MRTRLCLAGAAAAAIAASASADFSGFVADSYAVDALGNVVDFGDATYAVIDLYAEFAAPNTEGFDNADSTVLNVFGASIARRRR